MDALQLPFLAILPALAIVAGLKDLTSMKIPNWISGLLILGFFPTALLLHLSPMDYAVHLGVAAAALLIGMGLFALNFLGGGDVKLMAAASLWLGVTGAGMFVLWTAVIGGVFCLMLLFARAWLQPYVAAGDGWVARLMEPKGHIPYGVAIAAGVLVAYPASPLMDAFLVG
ncbi:prepilin peptidase CpaA [Brevundimonas alba]|uniref:Prepilin peptidase CpaA n=1 Tax=Brevundimonas alba TaxID=74314 RepID=A0A7X5YIL1_9CAUL|nr:prepilin peptidase [Brevundimonas alba]NJC40438.1 prepilin peptidase CpaA [Brevundimonas alba]